ncbi:MAG: hypothetical protein HQ481_12960 [Alphaproteobacteria bacterium]|nr:hypothetical protein [Alphaproteobacteria bacterium]
MSTTGYQLRQIVDHLDPNTALTTPLPALSRVLYCHRGAFDTDDGAHCDEDSAWFGCGAVLVTAGPEGAVIWRWELAAEDDPPILPEHPGITSKLNVAAALDGPDSSADWILRCDSVKFPIGGQAFPHVHQGPGIRVLREGQIRIDTAGTAHHYLPGQAWFEPGPEPVFAQASELECSRFVRVMILPSELKGKSSIQYVNAEDLEKPKSQRYHVYVDEPIEH